MRGKSIDDGDRRTIRGLGKVSPLKEGKGGWGKGGGKGANEKGFTP